MKTIKRVLIGIFLLLALLVLGVFVGLNSESVLNRVAKYGIEQSGLDVSFGKIKGGLFSGLEIEEFTYEKSVQAKSLKVDMDFMALKEGKIHVKDINLSGLHIDKAFLASLIDTNSSEKEASKKGDFPKEIVIDKAHFDAHDIHYQEHKLESIMIDIDGFSFDMKEQMHGDIKVALESQGSHIMIESALEGKAYDAQIKADISPKMIAPYLKEQNLSFTQVPMLNIHAKGDRENLHIESQLSEGKLHYQAIMIAPKWMDIKADVGLKSGLVDAKVKGNVDSDFARVNFDNDTHLNYHDINNTLAFKLKTEIKPDRSYLSGILKEQNASIQKIPKLLVLAQGDMQSIKATTGITKGHIKVNGLSIRPKKLDIMALYDLKREDVTMDIQTEIDSGLADVVLGGNIALNSADINNTLAYHMKGKIKAKNEYLQSQIQDANITLTSLSPLSLKIDGDARKLDGKFDLDGAFAFNELQAKPRLKDSTIHLDLVGGDLESHLDFLLDSNKGTLKAKSDVQLNTKDINNTLQYLAKIELLDAKPFMGVNLAEIGDMHINAKGSLKNLHAKVTSPKIGFRVESGDFDTFKINVETKKLYLGKIYAQVPEALQQSFVALKADGYYQLSQQEAKIKAKLKGFKYNKHTIFTNDFTFALKGEDITLSPVWIQSGKSKIRITAKKLGKNIVASIKNRALKADAKIHLDPLRIDADGEISSLDTLKHEINPFYPIDFKQKVDGKVKFWAKSQGEKIDAHIQSKRISFEEGRLENLNLFAQYQPNLLHLKKFDFKMAGFKGKGMNKQVRLARDGIITFDEENASIDVELVNLLKFKAKKHGDVMTGKFKTHKLALAYPEYGSTVISTDLEMFESSGKMAVTGEVRFKETEINYQSSFLDISKDSDIIIISKKNQKAKAKDTFLQNTFLDIKIISDDEILYKVDDGEIELKPDIIVRKEFGKEQRLHGKIKILGGMYDYADKRFKLEEGAVAFRGLKVLNPLLDLHVLYDEIDDVLIKIKIGGDKNRPKLAFSSEPQLSKKDIFSYLLFGMSSSETEGAASSANKAAERIFGRALAKDLARELNLDRLDMNRNSDGGIDVKAGKKIKRKTFVYYQNKSTESSVIVEHKLSKTWDITSEVGKAGQAVDFVFRKGFK